MNVLLLLLTQNTTTNEVHESDTNFRTWKGQLNGRDSPPTQIRSSFVVVTGTPKEVLFLHSAHLLWSNFVSTGAEYSRISTDTRNNATNDRELSENVYARSSFVWSIWVFRTIPLCSRIYLLTCSNSTHAQCTDIFTQKVAKYSLCIWPQYA